MIKRRKGICAVALLIGASGAGFGVAAAAGTASASDQAGGWHATTGDQRGAWHSYAAPGSAGSQAGRQAGVSPHAVVPAPTFSSQSGSDPGPGRHANGHWGGNGNGWGNGGGQGSQGSQGAPPAGTTTTSTTPTPPGPQGGSGGRGIVGHQGGGSHPGGTPPITTIIAHQGVGGTPQHGGGQSSGGSVGRQPSGAGRQGDSTGNSGSTTTPAAIQPLITSQPPVAPQPVTQPITPTPASTTPTTSVAPTTPTHTSRPSGLGSSNIPSDIAGLLGASHAVNPAPVTNGLGAALGLIPTRTGLPGAATGPLLTAATGALTAARTRAAAHHSGKTAHGAGSSSGSTSTVTRVITSIEHVVPGWVWLVLAASLALAAAAATAAFVATRRVQRQAGQFAAVTAAALTDPLTGVLNRRGFIEALERELARARRYNLRFVLAYVDVRNLKGVNDTEGHLAGDELLKDAAHLLKDSARADDVVGRIGGDEMGLLLVEQGAEGADVVINRITSQIPERQEALGLRAPWDLTVGTSSFPDDGSTATELLATADRRLYEQRGIALH